jgi:hypothetical protein
MILDERQNRNMLKWLKYCLADIYRSSRIAKKDSIHRLGRNRYNAQDTKFYGRSKHLWPMPMAFALRVRKRSCCRGTGDSEEAAKHGHTK